MASKKVREKTIKEIYEEFAAAGPLKQTVFPELLMVVSTAYNAGMPLKAEGEKMPRKKRYETTTFYFENKRDLEKRIYTSFVINKFYSSRQSALEGHSKIVKSIKRENPPTPCIHVKTAELKKRREKIEEEINSLEDNFITDVFGGGMWKWESKGMSGLIKDN